MVKIFLRSILLLSGLFYFSNLTGQVDDCLTRLDNAEVLFNSGIFEEIPLLLEDCLPAYSEENIKQAYKLIILAYYMNDDVESAAGKMKELLSIYPDYKPPVGAEAEFQFIYKSFRVRKIVDIGFMVGPIFTPGNIREPFSPFQDRFVYSSGFPGIQAGALISFPVNSFLSISSEPSISQYSFHLNYDKAINGIYAIEQIERNTMLEFPLNARITFLKGHYQPYLKLGGEISLLLSSETESKLDRLNPETNEIIKASESIKRDHSEFRNQLNYYAGGGFGLRINFNKFYLFAEADYYHPLRDMLASGKDRFNQNSLWTEGWMDSDFRIIQASFRVGIARRLYSIKQIR